MKRGLLGCSQAGILLFCGSTCARDGGVWIKSFFRVIGRRWFWLAAGLGVLGVGVGYREILRGVAHGWIVDEPPASASAIVILGGGEDYRPFAAARLWKAGLAPVILVPDVEVRATEALGLRPTTTHVILGVLKAEGVPESAIVRIGQAVTSTRDEAMAVRAWVDTLPPSRASEPRLLIIPTDPFATRRTNAFFEKTLPSWDVRVVRTDPVNIDVEAWWTDEDGLMSFQNEFIKTLFYAVKY
jgi:uncharacterized SAM-binding protein YcdF (DUF218 family)